MNKDVTETFTESDLDRALARFESTDPRVRNEDGFGTSQYESRDGFWNPAEDKYKPQT